MEIHEKIAESPDGEFEGVTVHDILTLIDDVDELFSGLLKWERIYRNICRMCRTRAFTS